MTTRVLTEDQILESYMQIAALEREIVKRKHEIARLRAQQANNSQESQKPVTQPENTDKHDTQPEDTYKPGTQPDENHATCDPERDQYDISRTDLTQRPCADGELRGIGPYEDSAGEPRAFPESCDAPSLPRFPTTICKGGVEGDSVKREIEQGINIRQNIGRLDDDGQRGAITVKSTLAGSRAIRARPSLGRGGVEAVESARPISLPLYGLFCLLYCPDRGRLVPQPDFSLHHPVVGGPGSIECFSYGGASNVSIEPPSLLSS